MRTPRFAVVVCGVLAAASLFASRQALAYEDGPGVPAAPAPFVSLPDPATRPPVPMRWYGYETLAADGSALALALPATTLGGTLGSGLGVLSGLTYALGAPIVHVAHGHVGKGFGDLGMRIGMPLGVGLLGGVVGAAAYRPTSCDSTQEGLCGLGNSFGELGAIAEGFVIGGLLGMAGAIAIDATTLAREPAHDGDDADAPPPPRAASKLRVAPGVGLTPERTGGTRATLRLVGTF